MFHLLFLNWLAFLLKLKYKFLNNTHMPKTKIDGFFSFLANWSLMRYWWTSWKVYCPWMLIFNIFQLILLIQNNRDKERKKERKKGSEEMNNYTAGSLCIHSYYLKYWLSCHQTCSSHVVLFLSLLKSFDLPLNSMLSRGSLLEKSFTIEY